MQLRVNMSQANIELWNTRWWNLLCDNYPLQGFTKPQIMFNNRLKTTAGAAYMESRLIHLSAELYSEYRKKFEVSVIPHELCHQVAYDIYQAKGHCPKWKSIMVKIGLKPDRCHTMINSKHEARKAGIK